MLVDLPQGRTDVNGTAVILQSNASQASKVLILREMRGTALVLFSA